MASSSGRDLHNNDYPPPTPRPPCGCDEDPIEALRILFVDVFQSGAFSRGREPATRPVSLRLHGVAHGTLVVRPDLPNDLRVGVFGQKDKYPIWVRFSSDVQPGRPDLKGTVGVALKVFGVEGETVLGHEGATTQDFILQNHDVFFVDTAKDMCEFTCLSLNGWFDDYVKEHPITGHILNEMEKVVDSVLGTPYWSVLPSRFGEDRYVKYKLEPEGFAGDIEAHPNYDYPFYLRSDLHERLSKKEARFRLLLQFRTDADKMPLDQATVRWSEIESVPVHAATLIMPAQDLDARGQAAYGEHLSFNPWHALAAHQPIGSIAEARRMVYTASADNRRHVDGVPVAEPSAPRPSSWQPGVPYPAGLDTRIVRAAIHPAIGIARVGNSADEFFVGPQIVPVPSAPAGAYRDRHYALKRQAAQFRIYGYNAAGDVVGELTADSAEIQWTVHVANSKAAWYQWEMALDVPEAASKQVPLRNAAVTGNDRRSLVIDGGPKTIAGKGTSGPDYAFQGSFMGTNVYLGELRTDQKGRLVFLGGRGVSASPTGSPIFNERTPMGSSMPTGGTTTSATDPSLRKYESRAGSFRWNRRGWLLPRRTTRPTCWGCARCTTCYSICTSEPAG